MQIEHVRALLTAKPFQAFRLHMADGRALDVRHPEFVFIPPQGRAAFVHHPDESFNIVDSLLVTDIEVPARDSGNGDAADGQGAGDNGAG